MQLLKNWTQNASSSNNNEVIVKGLHTWGSFLKDTHHMHVPPIL